MRRRAAVVFALAALVGATSPALSASPAPLPPARPAPAPTETPGAPAPPYEGQLLRLAEVVGALSYLRDLCGAGDGATFRSVFANLLQSEGTTAARKETLAGAFNRGFRDYERTYRACTPAARDIVARFLDEAARIAKDVADRYAS